MGTGFSTLKVIAAGIAVAAIASTAHAATTFNATLQPPGFYNGSGGSSDHFTVNETASVELGLGVNLRFVGPVTPASINVYDVPTGTASGSALWNFNYSVNLQAFPGSAGLHLSDITPTVTVLNIGNGQTIQFNPFISTPDNAGWNGTAKNAAAGNLTTDFGFQNSENLSFGFFGLLNPLFGFDPNANDTYLVTLSVAQTSNGQDLGTVQELIVAGDGAQTPLPAALPLFASGLGVFGFIAARRKRKPVAA